MGAENHQPDTEELPHPRAAKNTAATSEASVAPCPVCGLTNRPGELACSRCGTILANSGKTRTLGADEQPITQAHFPTGDVIVTALEPLVLEIDSAEVSIPVADIVTIGREADTGDGVHPDVDLNAYGAGEMGVSRQHIRIKRKNILIYIADLGSTNGTFLNGRRLIPNAERLLRNGDELLLGRLKMRVRF